MNLFDLFITNDKIGRRVSCRTVGIGHETRRSAMFNGFEFGTVGDHFVGVDKSRFDSGRNHNILNTDKYSICCFIMTQLLNFFLLSR